MQTDCLTEATLHAIPVNGFTQGFRDCEADFRSVFLLGPFKTKGREVRAGKAGTLVIDFAEVAAAKNSDALRKTEPGQANSA